MTKTSDIHTICDWIKSAVDDNSFIDQIIVSTPTRYDTEAKGIFAYGALATVIIKIININDTIPGILITCQEVSGMSVNFGTELNMMIERNHSELEIYLNGKNNGSLPIFCKSVDGEILDSTCWKKKA